MSEMRPLAKPRNRNASPGLSRAGSMGCTREEINKCQGAKKIKSLFGMEKKPGWKEGYEEKRGKEERNEGTREDQTLEGLRPGSPGGMVGLVVFVAKDGRVPARIWLLQVVLGAGGKMENGKVKARHGPRPTVHGRAVCLSGQSACPACLPSWWSRCPPRHASRVPGVPRQEKSDIALKGRRPTGGCRSSDSCSSGRAGDFEAKTVSDQTPGTSFLAYLGTRQGTDIPPALIANSTTKSQATGVPQ